MLAWVHQANFFIPDFFCFPKQCPALFGGIFPGKSH